MAMEKQQSKLTILMFPWLAHGHINPFLELSKRLSTTNIFDIYLCSTPVNLDSIRSTAANVKLVQLHMPSSPQLPPHLHTTKNLPSNLLPTLLKTFQESSSSFSDIVDSVKPDLLIYDFFQPWASKIAASKGIPSVYFSTSGATPFAFFHHVYTMGSASTFPFLDVNIPDHEMDRMRNRIVPNLKDADDDEFVFGNFARSTDIVLVKSYRDIETKYIDYLSVLSKKRIVSTGSLIAQADSTDDHHTEETSEILKWLNGKDRFSTVYISFGSECFLTRDEITQVARGLQLCNVNFLWVIRFPVGEEPGSLHEVLPEGFVEIVKERGLIVTKWAPQTKILAHPSIGGFVSHCGWSSITESMYFGVPIITKPMKSEQPVNAKMVVEAGVGVEVEKDGNGKYVGEEVAKAINKAMVDKTFCEDLRERARRLSEKIKENEEEEVNEVAEQLSRICKKNKKQV